MFEKEAKERARKLEESQTLGVYDSDEDYARDSGWNDGEIAGYEEGFKDGAEFGYNKANKWHYMKDGDLPKIGEKVLSEKGDLVIYKGDGFNWVEYSPNADNIKLRKWEEPRAWKEIVLPKENK